MNKTEPVRIDENQAMQLRVIKQYTGMNIKFVLGAALSEWIDRHCSKKTVAGKALAGLKSKWED